MVGDSSHPSLMGKSTARIALLGVSSINSKVMNLLFYLY